MALDGEEDQEYNGEELSSLGIIKSYLQSQFFMDNGPMEQWNVLSALQREIDLRYAVTKDRHISSFMDYGAFKDQTRVEALREIQREIYELAPNFIDMSQPYRKTSFYSFPTYFSPSAMNELSAHSIEGLFQNGTTPLTAENAKDSTIAHYKDFLLNCCYWLEQFRYVNACPYTFTLSTWSRDWEWNRSSDNLCSDYLPISACLDIWQYDCSQHYPPTIRKTRWDSEVGLSASNNGEQWAGVQIEVFQWFRERNLNIVDFTDPRSPEGMEYFNGFGANSTLFPPAVGEIMPYRSDGWRLYGKVDELTSQWTKYEWELQDPNVFPRHIPYDLPDWRCYVKLSTVTDWDFLEHGISPKTSAQWEAELSAGWDFVMTHQEISEWGLAYLSSFPYRGMTGRIIGIPVLSGSGSPSEGFFDERGHLMKYRIDLNRWSDIWQRWVDKEKGEVDTKLVDYDSIAMHKENVPLSATMENPFALSADACFVIYSNRLPESTEYRRDIDDIEISYPSYPTDGLRMDTVEVQHDANEQTLYGHVWGYQHMGANRDTYYYEEISQRQEVHNDGEGNHTEIHDERYLIDGSKSLVLRDEELSTAHWNSGWHILNEIQGYPDSFGLLSGELMTELSTELSDDTSSPDWYPNQNAVAHTFRRAFPLSAYSHETLFYHDPTQFPPIDYDLLKFFEDNPPDGPWYEGGGWGGIGNTVELTHNSEMRLFTFLDFGGSFNL